MFYIVLLLSGLYALLAGRFPMLPLQKARGRYARIAGALQLSFFPLVLILTFLVAELTKNAVDYAALARIENFSRVGFVFIIFVSLVGPLLVVVAAPPQSKQAFQIRQKDSFTVDEVAKILKKTQDEVRAMIDHKTLLARRTGGILMVDRDVLRSYIDPGLVDHGGKISPAEQEVWYGSPSLPLAKDKKTTHNWYLYGLLSSIAVAVAFTLLVSCS